MLLSHTFGMHECVLCKEDACLVLIIQKVKIKFLPPDHHKKDSTYKVLMFITSWLHDHIQ